MKICGHCDQPIPDDEPYTKHDIEGASSSGTTVYRHVAPCERPPTQTTQSPIWR